MCNSVSRLMVMLTTFYLFDHTWDTTVMYDKANCVCFINMQPHKVKFCSSYIYNYRIKYHDYILVSAVFNIQLSLKT